MQNRSPQRSEPPLAVRPSSWHALLSQCTDGAWYFTRSYPKAETANQIVYLLRNGKTPIPEGRWEFTVGKSPGGKHGIWARKVV